MRWNITHSCISWVQFINTCYISLCQHISQTRLTWGNYVTVHNTLNLSQILRCKTIKQTVFKMWLIFIRCARVKNKMQVYLKRKQCFLVFVGMHIFPFWPFRYHPEGITDFYTSQGKIAVWRLYPYSNLIKQSARMETIMYFFLSKTGMCLSTNNY